MGSCEETTPGTLTILHSSEKEIEEINIQERELHSSTVENKVPGYRVGYGILQADNIM